MRTFIRTLAAALLAVVALSGMAHADDGRFDARALATSSDALLAEPALGSPEVAELVAGEVYPARSQLVPGSNGWSFNEVQVDGTTTGYVLEGVVAIIPAEDPVSKNLTKRALVTSGGPVHAYPHPDSAPVGEVSTGATVYVDPSNGVEVASFLSTETLIPVETTDGGVIGWVPESFVQVVGERGGEDDATEPAEEPAEVETSGPTAEDPVPADEATEVPAPVDEEGAATGEPTEEPFTVLGRELTDPLLLGGAAGALLIVALGWAALRRRGGGRGAVAAASVPMTAPVVVEPVAEPEDDVEELVYDAGELEDDIEELVYDDGDDDVEEPVYDDAVPTTPVRASKDPFEF